MGWSTKVRYGVIQKQSDWAAKTVETLRTASLEEGRQIFLSDWTHWRANNTNAYLSDEWLASWFSRP